MSLELNTDQIKLLINILSDDCTYLENCTESEFQTYQEMKEDLDASLYYQESEFDGQVYTQGWKYSDEVKEINKFIADTPSFTPEDVTRTQLRGIKGNLL